jgi:hypothetical protein
VLYEFPDLCSLLLFRLLAHCTRKSLLPWLLVTAQN